ncbi:nitronate monooxygenase [Comamonadaceae bacterium G21597-S1]|nr:nitronate monooxygenase [Comamonadaceae bacterium G21597-S1]
MIGTRLTDMFGLSAPVVLAPMGAVSGGLLAAAVSNAGGLGMVGGGYGDATWLERELALVKKGTRKCWGAGLITWAADDAIVEQVLAARPDAVMLSFGDPRRFGRLINAAGCRLICQVQDREGAQLALEAGADLIVAQGTEAGGHGGERGTLPLVPAIVDLVAPIPVIAAGGIVDGRGLAAALMLGAHGALMGTRFYATPQALAPAAAKRRLMVAQAEATVRTRVFDQVRGYSWPTRHTGRALRNDFVARWHGRERELQEALEPQRSAYQEAAANGDCDNTVVWAGEGVDLITDVEDAGALVARIAREAEQFLMFGSHLVRRDRAG